MSGTTVLVHEWVTGGGLAGTALPPSWAAEGGAMRRALAADFARVPGVRVVMTLDARLPDEPGPWRVVPIGAGSEPEPEILARLARNADWTVLVAPETGGILADRTRIIEQAGGRSLGSTAEAIALTGDKLRLGAWLKARGIATPASHRVVPAEGLPVAFPYPAVLKPIDGAGAVDTFFIAGAEALPVEARTMPEALLQPYRPGVPMSASFLVGPAGRVVLVAVGRQRIEILGDRFVYRGGVLPTPVGPAIEPLRHAIASVSGLRGFVGIDFVQDPGGKTVSILEINPRATTSCVGLARLLPPGMLGRTWIGVAEGIRAGFAAPEELAGIVSSCNPLTFEADGTIDHRAGHGEGVA